MNDKYESTPAQPHHVEAMERAWLWMENQADGQSKGGHATFDLMMLREERDALRTAIDATPSPQAAQQAPAQPDLGTLNGLAKQYADSYASPHHFTLGVNGLRQIIQRALPQAAPAAPADSVLEDAGWYAVVVCWDENEGLYPSAARWTGSSWDDDRPIAAFHGPHETQEAAEKWAYDHDPEA